MPRYIDLLCRQVGIVWVCDNFKHQKLGLDNGATRRDVGRGVFVDTEGVERGNHGSAFDGIEVGSEEEGGSEFWSQR